MYEIQKKVGGVFIKSSGDTPKEVFFKFCNIAAAFEDETCGACKSDDILYRVRENKNFEFPEAVCKKCYAKLSFGISNDGKENIYPKRMVTDRAGKSTGEKLPNNGWVVYKKDEND